ncbi:MAG: YaaL family protein [Lachnospiraceae bacterium]|nr:YaaL family protein [Lachnospiraceae bacterium]MDE7435828.1 YaaL family protein [Lachnospiraceae bacterium]
MNLLQMLKHNKSRDEGYTLLLDDLARTKDNLDSAYANFQNVVEPDLIDAYIYEVNAMQLKYKFLLGRVKQIEDSYAKNPLESGSR